MLLYVDAYGMISVFNKAKFRPCPLFLVYVGLLVLCVYDFLILQL
jgi:hypothetical protein